MQEKTLWKNVKYKQAAWNHIRVGLAGTDDICACVICGFETSLISKERKRDSILLETARKHFYKHKIKIGSNDAPQTMVVELF